MRVLTVSYDVSHMETIITRLIEFYQQLPDDFYIVDHDADGYFCYLVAEGMAGLNWNAPELHMPVGS